MRLVPAATKKNLEQHGGGIGIHAETCVVNANTKGLLDNTSLQRCVGY